MLGLIKRWLDSNEKEIKRLEEQVARINALEPEVQSLPDSALQAKTAEFKARLSRGESLDTLLPEAFAVVREAARRTLGQRHFDVQLMGGIVLHEGRIAEMKTGEGKTLAATAPAYLNALAGRGVHVVTVNDYLARRDAEWMGAIYRFLGLKVGVVVHGLDYKSRQEAYRADITYGTNNEFGFDYLRDNMVMNAEFMVQRGLYYAIIDEVDSILIDEARTPLIISGQADEPTDLYYKFARLIPQLTPEHDYTVDEKARTAAFTEAGVAKLEKWLKVDNLYDDQYVEWVHHLNQALKAHTLFKRDRDYVVKDGQVIIVDEFTGRLMFGRRYSDGLHQAIEAKEGVKIERESQTLASITFQNYFRMYEKLAGMTGTAKTEEEEFQRIYGMDVVVIPTNRPMIRQDLPDRVYKTEAEKFRAVVEEIERLHREGRPVLVGTISIEKSERLSEMLKRRGIPHQVLNAKYHEKEAEIVAQAGRPGAVTIATNMAGRGTDILLGGNPEFLARERLRKKGYPEEVVRVATEHRVPGDNRPEPPEVEEARAVYEQLLAEARAEVAPLHDQLVALGGLHILGTERHESRRIDNQLRGRAGRQGDPGSSQFFISLEDDLMRLFGSDRLRGLMDRLGWEDGVPIEHGQVSRAIENAQKKVESRNFDLRKQVLEFDDVMNRQREVIYEQRRRVLLGGSLREQVLELADQVVRDLVDTYAGEKVHPEEWDLAGLLERFQALTGQPLPVTPETLPHQEPEDRARIVERLGQVLRESLAAREAEVGAEEMRELERALLLRVIDSRWMEHLRAMDELREGIGLRAYGQQNPLVQYKIEAFQLFSEMMANIREDVLRYLFRVRLIRPKEAPRVRAVQTNEATVAAAAGGSAGFARAAAEAAGAGGAVAAAVGGGMGSTAETAADRAPRVVQRRVTKVGRNDPCPCGSGKKYKKCCGA